MKKYILFLRSINVGGRNIIKMEALKNALKELGFENIKTILQSGNIVFDYKEENLSDLESKITIQIKEKFNLDIVSIVLDHVVLQSILFECPFLKDENKRIDNLYITFLRNINQNINLEKMIEKKDTFEEIVFYNNVICLYTTQGYSKTKISNSFIEKAFNSP